VHVPSSWTAGGPAFDIARQGQWRLSVRTTAAPCEQAAPDAVVLVATLLPRQMGGDAAHSGTAGASAGTQPATRSSDGSAALLDSQQESAGTSSEPAASEQRQQQQQKEQQPQHQRLDTDAGVLVGTVEMSFTDTTRTRFLTLNPPTVGH
jgi:hypothetical protein